MWKSICCPAYELNLRLLEVGQSFRWKKIDDKIWQGIADHRLWQLYQENDQLFYRILGENITEKILQPPEDSLKDYFQLNVKLTDLFSDWSKNERDEKFLKILKSQSGIRLLRQDPVECLFSFICSSNNNIKRITGMIDNLCKFFGQPIEINDNDNSNKTTAEFYDFPTVQSLAQDVQKVDERLRKLNFGYRSRYIAETAEKLFEIDNEICNQYLISLRDKSYEESRSALMQFSGVGGKVADCVCLMSLDKTDAVPVDTHILRLTADRYLPELKKLKSANDKTHKLIGDFYREKFGKYAGWAQAVLFANEV